MWGHSEKEALCPLLRQTRFPSAPLTAVYVDWCSAETWCPIGTWSLPSFHPLLHRSGGTTSHGAAGLMGWRASTGSQDRCPFCSARFEKAGKRRLNAMPTVECRRLDWVLDWFGVMHIDFFGLGVEGAELPVRGGCLCSGVGGLAWIAGCLSCLSVCLSGRLILRTLVSGRGVCLCHRSCQPHSCIAPSASC